ncbi:MAG: PIG-L family deacetylase [Oscillospiraceae bacterium]|nr:PIG-L family deacetylase [Oscillospiraceae bacterium]
MSLTKIALKFAAPAPKIEDFERFLFIGPHPDDIEIGAGATAAKLTAAGKQVSFLICLDGRYGMENAPAGMTSEKLIGIRKEEAIASARVLGVEDVRFLDFCDGGFYEPDALRDAMAKAVGESGAQVIFAPDPDCANECHTDHLNVGRIAKELAFFAPFDDIMARRGAKSAPVEAIALYMTARPNRFVKTAGYLERQLAALFDCHQSQFPRGCAAGKSIELYLKLRAADFGLRTLSRSAEGFRVLGRTQMHCLSEAGL